MSPLLKPHLLPLLLLSFLPYVTSLSLLLSPHLLHTTLQKPSKTLSVNIDISPSSSSPTQWDPSVLSMQLRKMKAATLWTSDRNICQHICKEQNAARGDFPGPCPVVFNGREEGVTDALEMGAAAVVLDVAGRDEITLQSVREGILEGRDEEVAIIWEVGSVDDAVTLSTGSLGHLFLLNTASDTLSPSDIETIISELNKISPPPVLIAAVDAMQTDAAEIQLGRAYKQMGCCSILVKNACCGDGEDVEYSQFVIKELSSKASSSFAFSGLTGSTNGHFGGVAASGSGSWKRMMTAVR